MHDYLPFKTNTQATTRNKILMICNEVLQTHWNLLALYISHHSHNPCFIYERRWGGAGGGSGDKRDIVTNEHTSYACLYILILTFMHLTNRKHDKNNMLVLFAKYIMIASRFRIYVYWPCLQASTRISTTTMSRRPMGSESYWHIFIFISR